MDFLLHSTDSIELFWFLLMHSSTIAVFDIGNDHWCHIALAFPINYCDVGLTVHHLRDENLRIGSQMLDYFN